jgi:hypothetical protein
VSEQMAFTFDERHDRLFGDVSVELLALIQGVPSGKPEGLRVVLQVRQGSEGKQGANASLTG